MMISIWWLIPVAMVSACFGVLITALLVASGRDNEKSDYINQLRTTSIRKKFWGKRTS